MNKLINQQIDQCVSALLSGKVVAFPTETVMGLGVVYNNRKATTLPESKAETH